MNRWLLCVCAAAVGGGAGAESPGAKASAERGAEAVRGRPALNPPGGTNEAYATVWKQWGVAEKPADYPRAIRDRYGLHVAPYDNGELPMGLHPARSILGRGVGTDCLMCHAGTVAGRTIIGLGNHALDVEALFSDLFAASGG